MGKNCAVIVAAGKGKRMGASISKQFLKIKDKPILYYTLRAFSECSAIDSIVVVLSPESVEYCKREIIEKYNIEKVCTLVEGGSERQNSVYMGLEAAVGSDIVLIHDGARPFVSSKIIEEGIKYAELYGACACGVTPKDTIKHVDSVGFSVDTPDRASLVSVQTPQCFRYDLILDCHKRIQEGNMTVTDDTMLVERYGHQVFIYEGDYSNIKITTPEDIVTAEGILSLYKESNK
jgi:2-C-methyl-D-erythritol 4-phosphate cytidylyltransferase